MAEILNARDYKKGSQLKVLAYGLTGAGKSTAFLTYPGKKFAYVFDPAGLETFAGHDVDYIQFIPEIDVKKGKLGKESKATEMLRPDPMTYLEFEKDFEKRAKGGFFDAYDAIGFESLTTLIPMMMWYILEQQGRGNMAPEIQDYYFRSDGVANIVRLAAGQGRTVFFSAHEETSKDEVSGRIENNLYLPPALKTNLPLMFSEVVRFTAATDKNKKVQYQAQMAPNKKAPLVRTSLSGMEFIEDVTIDWSKPPEGQGFFGLYAKHNRKSPEEIKKQTSVKMG